jgi:hypothetical protein
MTMVAVHPVLALVVGTRGFGVTLNQSQQESSWRR